MRRFRFDGSTAVVTGAAGGIGAGVALGLAARGCHLILIDRDETRLTETTSEIQQRYPAVRTKAITTDLSDPAAVTQLAATLAEHREVNLLVNNAGVALVGTFDHVTVEEFDWVLQINLHAVVALTHALLPVLAAHPNSHLANVSSLFGLVAPAGQTAYATSKFGVRGFTEALRHELSGADIGVTCVYPGGIATSISRSARIAQSASEEHRRQHAAFEALLTIPADVAAAKIIEGIERRRARVLIGDSARIGDLLARLTPSAYDRVGTAAMRWAARLQRLLRPGAARHGQTSADQRRASATTTSIPAAQGPNKTGEPGYRAKAGTSEPAEGSHGR